MNKVGRPKKNVPKEGEVKDGKIFYGGDWLPLGGMTEETEEPKETLPVSITIGENTLKATATRKSYPNSKRVGYNIVIDRGQPYFGNANIYISGFKSE